ncbi:TPA: DUF726 domain-containing protein [Vibrio vulnificus]|uniref:DUF726 domain-containing protein n=1 Tax=Vibrio vulnificus TaxID=672 RepID=A0A8H9K5D9_VIBVL|nr:DUF726 domain-containing protein [Vibrio vulnificus]
MVAKIGFCSWCFTKCEQELVNINKLSRNEYRCSSCGNYTLKCRICDNLAKGRLGEELQREFAENSFKRLFKNWNNELCAEHDGSIPSFSSLSIKLDDIADYEKVFQGKPTDVLRVTKIIAAGGLGLIAGVASGGTAVGILGGAVGRMALGSSVAFVAGNTAQSFYKEDKSFSIKKLVDNGSDTNTIFVNGFLQEGDGNFNDWIDNMPLKYRDTNIYGLTWGSGCLSDIRELFAKDKALKTLGKLVVSDGWRGVALKKVGLSQIFMMKDLVANPWFKALFRSEQAGSSLAEILSRTDGQKFNLVGHSLGCRVINYTLSNLAATKGERELINDVVLLGGAVDSSIEKWRECLDVVGGDVINFYSDRDSTLSLLYKAVSVWMSKPIGCTPIKSNRVINLDSTELVKSHTEWKAAFRDLVFIVDQDVFRRAIEERSIIDPS